MEISLIEFIVYGIMAYSGAVLLIASAFRETPATKSQSIVRVIYLSISLIACIILSGSGVNIFTEDAGTVQQLTYNVTDGSLISNVTSIGTTPAHYILQNPVWVSFHYMLAAVILAYMLIQILTLFTKV